MRRKTKYPVAAAEPAAAAVKVPFDEEEVNDKLNDVGELVGSPVAVETTAGEVTLPEFNALQTTNA